MNQKKLCAALEGTGLPVYLNEAHGPVRLPYLVYLLPQDTPLAADDVALADWQRVRVELYTARRDSVAEHKVRSALETLGVICGVDRVPIPEQRMHEAVFEFEMIEVREHE